MLLDIGDIPLIRLYSIWDSLKWNMLNPDLLMQKSYLVTSCLLEKLGFTIVPLVLDYYSLPDHSRVACTKSDTDARDKSIHRIYELYIDKQKISTLEIEHDGNISMSGRATKLYHSTNLEICTVYIDGLLDLLKPWLTPEELSMEFKQKLYNVAKEALGNEYKTITSLDKMYSQITKLIDTEDKIKELKGQNQT